LAGWFQHRDAGERKDVLLTVDGLPNGENCFVGYAGVAEDGFGKWYIHHYRAGKLIPAPNDAYNSPEEALAAFVEFSTNPLARRAGAQNPLISP
jgi:hypothetical protein